jgi:hypothetical protein
MRLYGILLLVAVVVVLYMTRAAHQTKTSDFYTKTQQALQDRERDEATKQRDAESVQSRLKAAEEQAKKAADDKYTSVKDAVEGPGKKGVAGRVEIDSQDGRQVPGVAAQGGRREQAAVQEGETVEDHEAEMAMNTILKQSPGPLFALVAPFCRMLTISQSSSFPRPTVRTRRKRNTSSWRNIASCPSRTWSSWTSTLSAHSSRLFWRT